MAGGLAPGPWAVGFTRLVRVDPTRPRTSGEPRPLDIGVWYPARAPGTHHLTFRAYFPPPVAEDSAAFAAFLVAQGADDSIVTSWLERLQ